MLTTVQRTWNPVEKHFSSKPFALNSCQYGTFEMTHVGSSYNDRNISKEFQKNFKMASHHVNKYQVSQKQQDNRLYKAGELNLIRQYKHIKTVLM